MPFDIKHKATDIKGFFLYDIGKSKYIPLEKSICGYRMYIFNYRHHCLNCLLFASDLSQMTLSKISCFACLFIAVPQTNCTVLCI